MQPARKTEPEDERERVISLLEGALAHLQTLEAPDAVTMLSAQVTHVRDMLLAGGDAPLSSSLAAQANAGLGEAMRIGYDGQLDDIWGPAEERIARSMGILYPIATRADRQTQQPPLPPRRRSKKSVHPVDDDRRQAPRVDLEADISFEGSSNFYTGFSQDISEGGLFIATYNLQQLGTKVALTFTLPNEHVVHAHGVVRWVRDLFDLNDDAPPGMGIMFEDLSEQDKEQIIAFINERHPLFYED